MITNQQRGLVALTRAQNAIEEYIGEELHKEFQRGVERGAFEQRIADRARTADNNEAYEELHGIGRKWATARAYDMVDDFYRLSSLKPDGRERKILANLFMQAMGFEDEP